MQPELFEQIKTIAEKKGVTHSDVIRDLIVRGLDERIYSQNAQLLAQIVREQMEQVLHSHLQVLQPRPKYPREVDPRRLALWRKIG